ncbi:unnamed protein product [Ilex paraguariensis]|uniref:Uncharacterized protein n=1 Tax=Ilex paraguariensis TaxID=185542 RepID=A0ABC8TGT8_9AQUA
MLEVACGKRPVKLRGMPDDIILMEWVLGKWKQGAILEASDPRLEGSRPSMRQVVQFLDANAMLPEEFMDAEGIGMAALMGNEFSNEFATTFPSSTFGDASTTNDLASTSLLGSGR